MPAAVADGERDPLRPRQRREELGTLDEAPRVRSLLESLS